MEGVGVEAVNQILKRGEIRGSETKMSGVKLLTIV
jgi:hypothetical protein